MTNGKPYIPAPPDADKPSHEGWTYKYYLLGNTTPVRVCCDETGFRLVSDAPDPQQDGRLVQRALIARLMHSAEVEDITKAEFVELCRAAEARHNPQSQRDR